MFIGSKIKTLKAYQKTPENNTSHLCNHSIAAVAYCDHSIYSGSSDQDR